MPRHFLWKTAQIGQKRHLFHGKWLGIKVLAQKCHKTQSSPISDIEIQYYQKDFKNSYVGLRTRSVTAAFGAEIAQNVRNGAKTKWTVLKKGENFGFQPKPLRVLDAKFNVDFDFAIKHDLILWSD